MSKKTNDPSTISAQEACFDFAPMRFISATRPKSEAQNRIRTIISLALGHFQIMLQKKNCFVCTGPKGPSGEKQKAKMRREDALPMIGFVVFREGGLNRINRSHQSVVLTSDVFHFFTASIPRIHE